jgi:7,8-dihydro-6-hydroxymethylpterin-pyrophosphokinase
MLLNHTQTIEKAGGRKKDVDEYNWDERLLNIDRSVFLFLQREEEWEKQK